MACRTRPPRPALRRARAGARAAGAAGARRNGCARRRPQFLEARCAQAHDLRETLEQQLPVNARGHFGEQWPRAFRKARAAVGVGEIRLLRQLAHQVFRQRHGAREARLECLAAFLRHQRVRVVPLGQEQKADLAPLARLGERLLQGAPGRGAPGAIAVEGKHHVADQPENPLQCSGVVAVPSVATA